MSVNRTIGSLVLTFFFFFFFFFGGGGRLVGGHQGTKCTENCQPTSGNVRKHLN